MKKTFLKVLDNNHQSLPYGALLNYHGEYNNKNIVSHVGSKNRFIDSVKGEVVTIDTKNTYTFFGIRFENSRHMEV
jgi:hypothetical protein